ncbi:hypothetical protein LCGC14_1802700 [marine sediment metagenome]|uniref:Uncharacterized protein n=1 Tax=marine sediment metagenome TaxID=412755 RepID=A0A0F9GP76_9ZZZZ
MSQKKPTTNQQLEEMRAMIANLEPGKVVTLDRELQERNTTLMLMLYGAVAKYGIGHEQSGVTGRIIVTAQVPVLQVPANHSLQWEVSEDGKSVMLYIVLNENVPVEGRTDKPETSPADVGDTAVGEVGASKGRLGEETPPPAPTSGEVLMNEPVPGSAEDDPFGDLTVPNSIGDDEGMPIAVPIDYKAADEFEDEIKVGLIDDRSEDYVRGAKDGD